MPVLFSTELLLCFTCEQQMYATFYPSFQKSVFVDIWSKKWYSNCHMQQGKLNVSAQYCITFLNIDIVVLTSSPLCFCIKWCVQIHIYSRDLVYFF